MRKFEKLIFDLKNGIKRKISSRRLKIQVTVEEFHLLSKKYFLELKKGAEKFQFKVDPKDKDNILFILRVYYGLWIEVNELSITIHINFLRNLS